MCFAFYFHCFWSPMCVTCAPFAGSTIDSKDIVDGHREKTLSLLWKIIFAFQVSSTAHLAHYFACKWFGKPHPCMLSWLLPEVFYVEDLVCFNYFLGYYNLCTADTKPQPWRRLLICLVWHRKHHVNMLTRLKSWFGQRRKKTSVNKYFCSWDTFVNLAPGYNPLLPLLLMS